MKLVGANLYLSNFKRFPNFDQSKNGIDLYLPYI